MEGRRGDLFNEVHHYIRSMSKLSARLVGVVTALVALAGVAFGVQAATAVSRTTLKITRTTFCTAENTTCDEPKGHVLQFSGWFDMRLLVTQADGLHNTKLCPSFRGRMLVERVSILPVFRMTSYLSAKAAPFRSSAKLAMNNRLWQMLANRSLRCICQLPSNLRSQNSFICEEKRRDPVWISSFSFNHPQNRLVSGIK